jgi:hypothetical protein
MHGAWLAVGEVSELLRKSETLDPRGWRLQRVRRWAEGGVLDRAFGPWNDGAQKTQPDGLGYDDTGPSALRNRDCWLKPMTTNQNEGWGIYFPAKRLETVSQLTMFHQAVM